MHCTRRRLLHLLDTLRRWHTAATMRDGKADNVGHRQNECRGFRAASEGRGLHLAEGCANTVEHRAWPSSDWSRECLEGKEKVMKSESLMHLKGPENGQGLNQKAETVAPEMTGAEITLLLEFFQTLDHWDRESREHPQGDASHQLPDRPRAWLKKRTNSASVVRCQTEICASKMITSRWAWPARPLASVNLTEYVGRRPH